MTTTLTTDDVARILRAQRGRVTPIGGDGSDRPTDSVVQDLSPRCFVCGLTQDHTAARERRPGNLALVHIGSGTEPFCYPCTQTVLTRVGVPALACCTSAPVATWPLGQLVPGKPAACVQHFRAALAQVLHAR